MKVPESIKPPTEKAQKGSPETGQQAESKFAAHPWLGFRVKEMINLIYFILLNV